MHFTGFLWKDVVSVLFNPELFLLGQSILRYLVQQSGSYEVLGSVVYFGKWKLGYCFELVLYHRDYALLCFRKICNQKFLFSFDSQEGSCIISGIGYNGKTEDGKVRWDGVRNVKLSVYETIYTFQVRAARIGNMLDVTERGAAD